MSDTLPNEVDPREVISDFMLQGHLRYETVGRASDYDRTDAMIRDLAAEGVAIISAAKLATLQREADGMREALTFLVNACDFPTDRRGRLTDLPAALDRARAALNGPPQATVLEDK